MKNLNDVQKENLIMSLYEDYSMHDKTYFYIASVINESFVAYTSIDDECYNNHLFYDARQKYKPIVDVINIF